MTTAEDRGFEGEPFIDVEGFEQRVGSAEVHQLVLSVLLRDVPPRLAGLAEALRESGDLAAAGRLAHAIRGTALNAEARRLAATAGRLEASIDRGDRDEATRLLAAMEAAWQQTRRAAEQLVNGEAS